MISYDTIISNFDDKVTLYNWLRKVEEALKNASATNFVVNKKGNATLSFSIKFADGTTLESGDIVLQQGESVQSATISDGHLLLTLTNGNVLDAGDLGGVTSFAINASQHLIVTYQNGTTADLGAISDFSNADFVAKTLTQTTPNWEIDISNIDLGYDTTKFAISGKYAKLEVVNNVLYFVLSYGITNISGESQDFNPTFIQYVDLRTMPTSIAQKIIDSKGNDLTYVNSRGAITAMHGFATYGLGTGEVRAEKLIALGIMNWAGISSNASIQLRVSAGSAITLANNASTAISFRTFLTLL